MKIELTPEQQAWIKAKIASRRFADEDQARAYLTAVIDDAMVDVAETAQSIEELRRLWKEGLESSESFEDGPAALDRIWREAEAKFRAS